jgi:hypothetical protein
MATGRFDGFINILEEEIGLTLPGLNDISRAYGPYQKKRTEGGTAS